MPQFKIAHSDAGNWKEAVETCVTKLGDLSDGPYLGMVYVTDHLADEFADILSTLSEKTGLKNWTGTVGMGICATGQEYFDRPAIAVMAVQLPESAFHVVPTLSDSVAKLSDESRQWIEQTTPLFGVVHADSTNPNIPSLIEDFAETTGGFLVGGLTSSRRSNVQVANRITGGGISGVLFAPDVEVATGLSQGCSPIGKSHEITDCEDNILIELDGRSALEVFKEDVGDVLARDLNRAAGYIHAAFPIEGSDTGDYLVRSLVGIDPAQGWLAVGGEVERGDRVMFVRRDPESAAQDLTTMLTKLKDRLPNPPIGGLYFSCLARGPNMFGEEGREIRMVHDVLGDFPLVGFYANGEISNDRLYGYTGVIALFV